MYDMPNWLRETKFGLTNLACHITHLSITVADFWGRILESLVTADWIQQDCSNRTWDGYMKQPFLHHVQTMKIILSLNLEMVWNPQWINTMINHSCCGPCVPVHFKSHCIHYPQSAFKKWLDHKKLMIWKCLYILTHNTWDRMPWNLVKNISDIGFFPADPIDSSLTHWPLADAAVILN